MKRISHLICIFIVHTCLITQVPADIAPGYSQPENGRPKSTD